MRTTMDLPLDVLDQVQACSGAATRREAVILALTDYLRRRRREAVLSAAGTLDLDLDAADIRAANAARERP
jgi:Arc/MetJ family transcription regulator